MKRKGNSKEIKISNNIWSHYVQNTRLQLISLWIYGYQFPSLHKNPIAKRCKLNLQASPEPCINDAIEVVEKKLYNRPILNQVLGNTLSFE